MRRVCRPLTKPSVLSRKAIIRHLGDEHLVGSAYLDQLNLSELKSVHKIAIETGTDDAVTVAYRIQKRHERFGD